MKFSKTFMLFVATAAVSACGTSQKDERAAEAPVAEDAAPTAPALIVAKVPVGADGVEQLDAAETRELMAAVELTSAEAAEQAFGQGETVVINDDLDEGSAQQWRNRPTQRHYYWSKNSYAPRRTTTYRPTYAPSRPTYSTYTPYLYYGGYTYGYKQTQKYTWNGCNYYVYGSATNYGTGYNTGWGYGW